MESGRVIFILGSTGTGKSRLAIELALRFGGEIINSDKIQVYRGLDVVTNKVTGEERKLVQHHLLGVVDNADEDFTVQDFRREVKTAVETIVGRGRLPIIAGGSNRYIQALVEDCGDEEYFRSKFDVCLIWMDVEPKVLKEFVFRRVEKMVESGLVEEVREAFHPKGDYSRGVRRAIGVPEMHDYFLEEGDLEEEARRRRLERAIEEIKVNTYELTVRQREKIVRFREVLGWDVKRIDATPVFLNMTTGGVEAVEEAWLEVVREPAVNLVRQFLSRPAAGDVQYD